MNAFDYRVAKRPEPKLDGAWGLWSAIESRWLDLLFATERDAEDALTYLLLQNSEDNR